MTAGSRSKSASSALDRRAAIYWCSARSAGAPRRGLTGLQKLPGRAPGVSTHQVNEKPRGAQRSANHSPRDYASGRHSVKHRARRSYRKPYHIAVQQAPTRCRRFFAAVAGLPPVSRGDAERQVARRAHRVRERFAINAMFEPERSAAARRISSAKMTPIWRSRSCPEVSGTRVVVENAVVARAGISAPACRLARVHPYLPRAVVGWWTVGASVRAVFGRPRPVGRSAADCASRWPGVKPAARSKLPKTALRSVARRRRNGTRSRAVGRSHAMPPADHHALISMMPWRERKCRQSGTEQFAGYGLASSSKSKPFSDA